ncbi:MAG: sulfotransferase family protein [Gammaproteobacteria bacterium]|nr:sulfotransferase family protein [Gammaproteobacteria bacterium]
MAGVLNRKSNFLFVHVPKTAGKSVEAMLLDLPGSAGVDLSYAEKARGQYATTSYLERRLTRLSAIEKWTGADRHSGRKQAMWAQLYKFCFVRHPVDRAISAYRYCMRNSGDSSYRQPFGQSLPAGLSFAEFIRLPRGYNYEVMNHFQIPQSEYIRCADTAMDFVGKFENLDEDIAAVAEILKLPLPQLERKNVSATDQNEIVPTAADLDLIAQCFAEDFAQFGYRTE